MLGTTVRCTLALAIAISIAALADARHVSVSMKDGRTFEGEIVDENSKEIVLSYTLGSLKTKMTFARADIASIQNVEAPAAEPEKKPEPDRGTREKPRERERTGRKGGTKTRYLEVPLEGRFGLEWESLDADSVTAEGVGEALVFAERRGLEHVVLVLAGDSGHLYESVRIAEVIADASDELRVSAFVETASPYATPIVLASDDVFLSDGLGPDVMFGFSPIEGIDESELIARFERLAERGGRDVAAARALIERGGSTLNASDVDAVTVSGSSAIGAAIGEPDWASAGRHGRAIVKRTARATIETERARHAALKDVLDGTTGIIGHIEHGIPAMVQEANDADPANGHYTVYEYTRHMTDGSIRRWQSRTDKAVAKWMRIGESVSDLAKKKDEYEKALNAEEDDLLTEQADVYWAFVDQHVSLADEAREAMAALHGYGETLGTFQSLVEQRVKELKDGRGRHSIAP